MRFNNPQILWFLSLVPVLAVFLAWSWRKKRELMTRFIQARLLASLTVGLSPERQRLRFVLLVAAVALLIFILARPQWGFGWEESRSRGLDIIVAIDTSRSMLAEDVNPNRLKKAQLAALDLKRLAKADRLGLVAFAGSAFLQCPLSLDDEAFRQSVNALDVNIIPQGGTALAEAIETARAAFKEGDNNDKALVLITDGEDHDGEAVAAAERAAKIGMRIFTIGVGTENGELLRIRDRSGRNEYIKDDQGNVVKSRLDEKLLQQIAQATGGFYQHLVGAHTIDWLYERGLGLMKKSDSAVQMTQRFHERYQWLLGLALLLLLGEMLLPERKSVKRANPAALAPATAELRKAVGVLLLLLALPALATASPGSAKKKYETGKFDSARREYQELLEKKPDDSRLNYNAGTAAYQAGKYEQALKHLNAALATPEVPLQERAYYNLGNARFRMGEEESDLKAKSAAWQEATNHFGSALKLDANDADARHNLEVVAKKLEELQKQQQQNKDQGKDKNKDDKQDDQKDQQNQQDKDKQDKQKDQQDQKSQQQKDEEKKKQEEQQKQQQEKNDQPPQDQRDPAQSQKGEKDKDGKDGEPGRPMKVMQMTPQQAMQLLDAQKSEEKALMFIPPTKTNRHDRVFKDW